MVGFVFVLPAPPIDDLVSHNRGEEEGWGAMNLSCPMMGHRIRCGLLPLGNYFANAIRVFFKIIERIAWINEGP
jgi:hypothetical protein